METNPVENLETHLAERVESITDAAFEFSNSTSLLRRAFNDDFHKLEESYQVFCTTQALAIIMSVEFLVRDIADTVGKLAQKVLAETSSNSETGTENE